jgi:hypothetical protein
VRSQPHCLLVKLADKLLLPLLLQLQGSLHQRTKISRRQPTLISSTACDQF